MYRFGYSGMVVVMGELDARMLQMLTVIAVAIASITAMVFAFPHLSARYARIVRWHVAKRRMRFILKSANRYSKRRQYGDAQKKIEEAIALYRQETGRPYASAKLMLSRANMLATQLKHPEALKAYAEFIKALEIDRSLTRDEREYLILFAGAKTIETLRRHGHYILMDELRPLWNADFSRLHDLKVPIQTSWYFPVRRPAVPFEYKPERMAPSGDEPTG